MSPNIDQQGPSSCHKFMEIVYKLRFIYDGRKGIKNSKVGASVLEFHALD